MTDGIFVKIQSRITSWQSLITDPLQSRIEFAHHWADYEDIERDCVLVKADVDLESYFGIAFFDFGLL